ncbi:hypothetical protein TTRE_0000349301 [Trichuris trichiura]|uniref:Prolyl 3,4-dihydroxylase TPA1/OFD1 N-terminal domain-containing protein n=1 Tax=Trichuris trichiura TaxID=36087 RepID=A0A077Z540_TRITR|nr:hypothetical protein TTRE_0000349301 [Trichuris trichiura]
MVKQKTHPSLMNSPLMDSCSSFQLFINKDVDNVNFLDHKDFESYSTPFIETIKKFFYGQVRDWISELTGIRLDEKVALSSSMYGPGDYLLCHDDQLEGRVIAFVLYLTEGWTALDGGRLDIFTCDGKAQQTLPTRSFRKLSIHGWYFGDPIVYPARIPSLRIPYNCSYFEEERQVLIQSIFEAKSEIELHFFRAPSCSETCPSGIKRMRRFFVQAFLLFRQYLYSEHCPVQNFELC